jgi:hypothetical protein
LAVQDKTRVRHGRKALPLSDDEGDDAYEGARVAFGSFCPDGGSDVDKQDSDQDSDTPIDIDIGATGDNNDTDGEPEFQRFSVDI